METNKRKKKNVCVMLTPMIIDACPKWQKRPAERWRDTSAGSCTGISGSRIIPDHCRGRRPRRPLQ